MTTLEVAKSPEWNLDGVFYSALMHPNVGSIDELHRQVYADVDHEIPKASAEALTQGSKYRRQLRRSAEVFGLQLPFYLSKPLYYWLGRVLTAAGMSSIVAPYAVSAVCFGLIGMLIPLFAIRAGARPWAAASFGALAMWLPQLRELGALAAPDALATVLLASGAAISLSSMRFAGLPLAAAVLARPDVAILGLGVLFAVWLRSPTRVHTRQVVLLGVAIALLAALVIPLSGGYDWPTVIRHTFIKQVVHAIDLERGLTVHDYFEALGRGLQGHMTNHAARFPPYLVFAGLAFGLYMKRGQDRALRGAAVLLAVIWGATLVRFVAMPLLADRFFAPAYVVTLALACALIVPREHLKAVPTAGSPL